MSALYFENKDNTAIIELQFADNRKLYCNKDELFTHVVVFKKLAEGNTINLIDESIVVFNEILGIIFNKEMGILDNNNTHIFRILQAAYRYDIIIVIDFIKKYEWINIDIDGAIFIISKISSDNANMKWLIIKLLRKTYKNIDVSNIVDLLNLLNDRNIKNDEISFMVNNDFYDKLKKCSNLSTLQLKCFNYINAWDDNMIIFADWLRVNIYHTDADILYILEHSSFTTAIDIFSKLALKNTASIINKITDPIIQVKFYKLLLAAYEKRDK